MFSKKSDSLEITSPPERLSRTVTDYGSISDNDENPSINEKKKLAHANHKPFLGLFYTSLSVVCFHLISVIVKKIAYMDPSQLSLIRNVGIVVGSLPVAIYCTQQILGEKGDRCLLLLRGFLSATGLYISLIAYKYLPLADAAILQSTLPMVTTVIARLFIKESCGIMQTICLILTVIGVLLSAKLPELLRNRRDSRFDYMYFGGLAAALASVLCISVSIVLLRKLRKVHYSIPMLYIGLIGMIENVIINVAAAPFVSALCGWHQWLCLAAGVLGFLGSQCFIRATQVEFAGLVAVEKSCVEIISSVVLQILFFFEYPDLYTIVGACLVIVSLSILGIKSWLFTLPENSKLKKKLNFFLL